MVLYSNSGLKTELKKPVYGLKCPVLKWSAKSHDLTIWIPDTHTVRYSDESGSQLFGIQMVTVIQIQSLSEFWTLIIWKHLKTGLFRVTMLKTFKIPEKYSEDLNTNHLNTGNIWIQNFMKFRLQTIWNSNGWFMCSVLCTRLTIWKPNQCIRKQDGVHLSGIQVALECRTIWHPTSFPPSKYQTSSVTNFKSWLLKHQNYPVLIFIFRAIQRGIWYLMVRYSTSRRNKNRTCRWSPKNGVSTLRQKFCSWEPSI